MDGPPYQLFFSGARGGVTGSAWSRSTTATMLGSSKSTGQGGQVEMLATVVYVQMLAAQLAAGGRVLQPASALRERSSTSRW